MKDRVLAALLTVLVFGAGFWAGSWHESTRPLPPPPGHFLGEFGGGAPAPGNHPPVNRAHLAKEIERLKPQIEAYQERMHEIETQFDHEMAAILTPTQQAAWQDWQKRRDEGRRSWAPKADETKPLTDEQIGALMRGPAVSVFHNVILSMRLDQYTRDLKLDEHQRNQARDLLKVRRAKFLELVDNEPPPSLTLVRLAPWAQRLSTPASPAPGSAQP